MILADQGERKLMNQLSFCLSQLGRQGAFSHPLQVINQQHAGDELTLLNK